MADRWSRSEDGQLRHLYRASVPVRLIAQELGRSENAVVARRRALSIPSRRGSRGWSEGEDALLRLAHGSKLPIRVLAAQLHRTVPDIRTRRRQLGLPSAPAARRYSLREDELLRAGLINGTTLDQLAERLGRSTGGIRARAVARGWHVPDSRRRWTADEDALLRDGYAEGLRCEHIATTLPGRTSGSVIARARKLGLTTYARRWTREDDARLRSLVAREITPAEAARALGRTPEAIRRRARILSVQLPPVVPRGRSRWTQEEDALLALHPTLNPAILSEQLQRSDRAIVRRLYQLGLRDRRQRSPHHPALSLNGLTPGERRLLDRELPHASGPQLLSLARRLERSPLALRNLAGNPSPLAQHKSGVARR